MWPHCRALVFTVVFVVKGGIVTLECNLNPYRTKVFLFLTLTLSYLGGGGGGDTPPILFFLHHPKTAQDIKLKLSGFKDTLLRHICKSNQFVKF